MNLNRCPFPSRRLGAFVPPQHVIALISVELAENGG
jgi:hypothetical protein